MTEPMAPQERPQMTHREHSNKDGWSDCNSRDSRWTSAARRPTAASWLPKWSRNCERSSLPTRLSASTRSSQRASQTLTADRLTAIKDRLDTADGNSLWLTEQLTIAWDRLDTLRDRIKDAGSLMHNSHVAHAIDYVRRTRPTAT
ncbi:hypothetical protein [Streptomyces sp. NPDC086010]|uniref:hypothetical protein n=1 Tax=Streptomyces sp. NPDC086010 TaxID=3365745 RepID=UPI0037D2A22D